MEPFFCCVNKKLFCTQARFTQDEYNLNKQFIKPSINASLQYICRKPQAVPFSFSEFGSIRQFASHNKL